MKKPSKKEFFDLDSENEDWSLDEGKKFAKTVRSKHRHRPHIPIPPTPPVPPLPPEFELKKAKEVIGIRGLDKRLYKDIGRIAKNHGIGVADIINPLLAKYRYETFNDNHNTIGNIKTLELHQEELANLDDEEVIHLVSIKTLLLGPDITAEAFKKIGRIEYINRIWTPSHLYLPLLKKAKNCKNIEKYKGDRLPLVLQKSFDTNVHLSQSFFEYFLETEEMVDLTVYGDLHIDSDIKLGDFKKVIYSLHVDGNIQAPRHLIGYLFAKAECYGSIEESDEDQ